MTSSTSTMPAPTMTIKNKQQKQQQNEFSDQEFYALISNNIKELQLRNQKFERNLIRYNFGNCKICLDKASGIHYGVTTCEGCKGFFKRSLEKYDKYVCPNDKKCTITPRQRKKCKYCRWMTCLKVGMSFECIKMGRIPNAVKERSHKINPGEEIDNHKLRISNQTKNKIEKNQNNKEQNLTSIQKAIQTENKKKSDSNNVLNDLTLKNLINSNKLTLFENIDPSKLVAKSIFVDYYLNTSNESHLFVLTVLRDKSFQIFKESTLEFDGQYERAKNIILNDNLTNKYDYSEEFVKLIWKKDLKTLTNNALWITKMIKEAPGFSRLSSTDQNIIMNEQFFTILNLRTTKLFIDDEYYLMLDENIQLSKKVMGIALGERVRDKIFEFKANLNSFRFTDYELGLLIPFFLTIKCPSVTNQDLLKELNDYYSRSLLYEFTLNKRSIEFVDSLIQLINVVPTINKMCRDIDLDANNNKSSESVIDP